MKEAIEVIKNTILIGVISPFIDYLNSMMLFFILALVLVLVDMRFGVKKAKLKGEEVRFSNKWRRTIGKLIDYFCWICLAGLIGETFGKHLGIPLIPTLTMLAIYGIEVESCFRNYYEAKGYKIKNGKSMFMAIIKRDIIEKDEILISKSDETKPDK